MKTIEIKGHVYARVDWEDKLQFAFFDFVPGSDWFKVCDHKIVTEYPSDFDPRTAQIEELQRQITKARADFTALVTSLTEQINNLQALPFTPAEV